MTKLAVAIAAPCGALVGMALGGADGALVCFVFANAVAILAWRARG